MRISTGVNGPPLDGGEKLPGELVLAQTEGRCALDCGVQRRAEGEHIRGRLRRHAPGDLWGQVRGGAGDQAVRGGDGVVQRSGDAEVGDLDRAVVTKQYVARLDISVHDADGVRGDESGRGLGADLGDLIGLHRAVLAQHEGETAGRDVLHDQPGLTVLLDYVEDGHHVRVLQPGRDSCLAHGA